MKHLKIYEDSFSQSKFRVGDIVKIIDNLGVFNTVLKPGINYFEIIEIEAEIDDEFKYLLHNIIDSDYMEFYDTEDNLELVPEYELAGLNYNL